MKRAGPWNLFTAADKPLISAPQGIRALQTLRRHKFDVSWEPHSSCRTVSCFLSIGCLCRYSKITVTTEEAEQAFSRRARSVIRLFGRTVMPYKKRRYKSFHRFTFRNCNDILPYYSTLYYNIHYNLDHKKTTFML